MTSQTIKSKNKPKLRFAALCRVSTESQEKKGESLRTQRKSIEESVKQLSGEVVSWYGGQEHATSGHEKKEVDRLLHDAQRRIKKFDAFIVNNEDRWSRDNVKSKQGLDVFRSHDIRFFVGTMEYDLFNPSACLYLGMAAEIGGFFAATTKKKSLLNRIERAKRGCPSRGNLPYGRTFNKSTETWGVDAAKKALIEDVAKRYLAGERMADLATEYKMNTGSLHKIVTKQSSTELIQTFNSDELNIHATIKTEMPELLSKEVIKAVHERTQANRTYHHGQLKNRYLLSRMVFCAHCDYSLFGATNTKNSKWQYYRHISANRVKGDCNHDKGWIVANELEDIVLCHLFETFGNPVAIQKAIEEAIPNLEQIKVDEKRLAYIESELKKESKARDRIIGMVRSDTITEKQASSEIGKIKKRESTLQTELSRLQDDKENRPDLEKIKSVSKKVSARFKKYRQTKAKLTAKRRSIAHDYDGMTWQEKRTLVETVFSGKTTDGKRMGIYIEWNKDGKSWRFDIHGHLIEESGLLLLSDSMKKAYFSECGGSLGSELLQTKYAKLSAGASRRTLTPRGENNCCTHGLKGTSR